jgi:hypothetical protein
MDSCPQGLDIGVKYRDKVQSIINIKNHYSISCADENSGIQGLFKCLQFGQWPSGFWY